MTNDLARRAPRIFLGLFLIYAGVSKLPSAYAFAETLSNYRLFPAVLNHLMAVTLPWSELVTGLLLAAGLVIRASAFLSALLFSSFAASVAAALARGLDIDCGCFGTSSGTRIGLQTLGVDLVGIAASSAVIWGSRCPRAAPKGPAPLP